MSAIGLAKTPNLKHNDVPPKVDLNEIKAIEPRVIIVFMAEENCSINLLKAPSTSYFKIRIGVFSFFRHRATMKYKIRSSVKAY